MQVDRNWVVVDKVLLWAILSDIWKPLAPAGRGNGSRVYSGIWGPVPTELSLHTQREIYPEDRGLGCVFL